MGAVWIWVLDGSGTIHQGLYMGAVWVWVLDSSVIIHQCLYMGAVWVWVLWNNTPRFVHGGWVDMGLRY